MGRFSSSAPAVKPATPLYVAPASAGAVGEGRFGMAGSGKISLAVAGNLRAYLLNDSAVAQRAVQLVRISVFTTGTAWADFILNPTTGIPPTTARRPKMNALLNAAQTPPTAPEAASPLDVRVDTDATIPLGGGVSTGITFGMPANDRTTIDLPPLVLYPGQALGINDAFAGAADVAMSVYWVLV